MLFLDTWTLQVPLNIRSLVNSWFRNPSLRSKAFLLIDFWLKYKKYEAFKNFHSIFEAYGITMNHVDF